MARSKEYISLSDAARYSGCYSQEYLSLRARQGKLKATKIGRNWITTKEWLDEYLERVNNYKDNKKKNEKSRPSPRLCLRVASAEQGEAGYGPRSRVTDRYLSRTLLAATRPLIAQILKVRDLLPVRKLRFVTVAYVLVFLLLSAGVVFGYPYLGPTLNSVKDFIRTSANALATDIWDGSREVSIGIEQFVSDTSEEIIKITDNISESVSDFATNISAGAGLVVDELRSSSPLAIARVVEGFSQVDQKIGNNLMRSQRFVTNVFRENLTLPLANVFNFFKNKSQPKMTFGEYVQNDIQNLKKLFKGTFQNIGYKIAISYQNVIGGLKGIGKGINKSLIQPTKNLVIESKNIIVSVPGKIGRAIAYPFVKTYQFVVRPWSGKYIDEEEIVKEIVEQIGTVPGN